MKSVYMIEVNMKCLRCHNTDPIYFYNDRGTYYCRKCIQFGRLDINTQPRPFQSKYQKKHRCKPKLSFELTPQQKQASQLLCQYVEEGKNVLVYACCGAGKTEITYEMISRSLNKGLKVGFAISRRQVVLEIAQRMKEAFPSIQVIQVCQGYTDIIDGELIVCTMHQLYRYHQAFDILIMDEVDAFPYKNNEVLEAVAHHATRKTIVYLTATPDEKMLKEVEEKKLEVIEVFTRPHQNPLILPTVYKLPFTLQLFLLVLIMFRTKNQMLIFVPTIQLADTLALILCRIFTCSSFTSKTENKEEKIEKIREGKIQFIFTTTILERGITLKGIDIVVLQAQHPLFDEASLIQIIGRVGRSKECPTGKGYFLCSRKTTAIRRCERALIKMNETL